MDKFSIMVSAIQKYKKVETVRKYFNIISLKYANSKDYKEFHDKYIQGYGCFAKTTVNLLNGDKQDVLCFSGLKYKSEISRVIKLIVTNGNFKNAYLINVSGKIRYYINKTDYITKDDADKSGFSYHNRMFSCCERKTFAAYENWMNCKSYVMTVKYQPCELCKESVKRHNKKYNGKKHCGKRLKKLSNRSIYDSQAVQIYNTLFGTKKRKINH